MKLSIVGTGYVGLVTGACLADRGHDVTCVDTDAAKVERINRAESPIHEQGLPELLRRHVGSRLRATTDLAPAVLGSELTFIAAGTPFDGNEIDLRYVKQVARDVGAALRHKAGYHVVVVKSTVVPGTTDGLVLPLLEEASGKRAGADFGVGMNPEFLSEGVAVADFTNADRIVLGGIDERTTDVVAKVYESFAGTAPFIRTNNHTAEMIKYASNAFQATCVSFANEIANLCADFGGGIDALDVMDGVHRMKELSPDGAPTGITRFLLPGCGFGGSCFPKDLKALIAHARKIGSPTTLLEGVLAVNGDQPGRLIDLLRRELGGRLAGARITVLGLAFKPDTDDLRESPAIPVIEQLLGGGAAVTAYDPAAMPAARRVFENRITFAGDLPGAVRGARAAVLVTRWDEFRALPQLIAELDPPPVLIDGRRMIDPRSVPRYAGVGFSPTSDPSVGEGKGL
jgi:UDPglucose 6-dehydrogenase